MARIHLRVGLVALARAELETMAGRGELDGPALADLAEARWRTGDLPGAGEAARAHLDGGGDEPIAAVVAAEAEAARGRFADGRALAMRLHARSDLGPGGLERLLGGRARAPFWPSVAPTVAPVAPTVTPVAPTVAPIGLAPAVPPPPPAAAVTAATSTRGPAEDSATIQPVSTEGPADPIVAVAGADRATLPSPPAPGDLAADPGVAAARLGLLLRQRSLPAATVLEQADAALAALPADLRDGPVGGAFHLVRGDAYRQMGREEQAGAAYRACWTALENLPPSPTPKEVP